MNCKHCNLSMKLIETSNRYLCETCQHSEPAVPVPPPSSNSSIEPLDETSALSCQACDGGDLEIGRIHKTEVCFCSCCGGFAIDRGPLGDLVEDLRAIFEGPDSEPIAFAPDQLDSHLDCLVCQNPMEAIIYNGPGSVVIATCDTCNVSWVKEGDLDRIVRAPGRRSYEKRKLPGYTIYRTGLLKTPTIFYHD